MGAIHKSSRGFWRFGLPLMLIVSGCHRTPSVVSNTIRPAGTVNQEIPPAERNLPEPVRIVLAPVEGDSPIDKQIALAQKQVRTAPDSCVALEKLGWLFVSKARASFDPGYYKLAEQCALGMEAERPAGLEALLLRGHVLQNLHRFKEAEPLARKLVAQRGGAFDYGLLGDVLMEQGRLDEAITAYQKMADLKPDLHVYTRCAHVRWLKGDLEGAIQMMQLSVQAASPRDAESAAWVYSRMAWYQLQTGQIRASLSYCAAALEFQKDYPPALLGRGRALLAAGRISESIECLQKAAVLNPLPEYQWMLAEALRAGNQTVRAEAVEQQLKAHGATADPRTYALFLATHRQDVTNALRLANAELNTRRDVFTYDALAWALAAEGRWSEAASPMQRALAEGTRDARLFLHAGIIAAENGNSAAREQYLHEAESLSQLLLPSEKTQLEEYLHPSPNSSPLRRPEMRTESKTLSLNRIRDSQDQTDENKTNRENRS